MENIMDILNCFYIGKCTRYNYEYTFIYNGQEINTNDYCYTIWGNTTCKLEDKIYKNVSYTSELLNKEEYVGFPFGMLILPFVLVVVFKELLMCAIRS